MGMSFEPPQRWTHKRIRTTRLPCVTPRAAPPTLMWRSPSRLQAPRTGTPITPVTSSRLQPMAVQRLLPVTSTTPISWNIAGQTFLTGANTVVFGNPQPGDWVSFEGRLLADGSRFADRIALLSHSPENQYAFTGKVESVSDTTWTVSRRVVQVNAFSEIEPGLKVGDTVQVAGSTAADGSLLGGAHQPDGRRWFKLPLCRNYYQHGR